MMDNSKNKQNEYLGVNKIGKNIRKSPLHQPNFVGSNANNNNLARNQPQAQVYNISKSDFRSIVQQLTGSPSRQDPLPRPPTNPPPKHPSMRLQRIRPPPLNPVNRPQFPPVIPAQAPTQMQPPPLHMTQPQTQGQESYYNNRPPPQFGQPSPRGARPFAPSDGGWGVPALSPISAYMQQLQSCIGDGSPRPSQTQQPPQIPGNFQGQPQFHSHIPSPRHSQPPMHMQPQPQPQPPLHLQGPGNSNFLGPSAGLLPNPNIPPLPSPVSNGPALLPSPTSQFLLPSPSFFNMLSPINRSPYPLLSPGSQFLPPWSPNFAFSPLGRPGILGPGPQPPLSPGYTFPMSPSGLLPISSPRWRDPSF